MNRHYLTLLFILNSIIIFSQDGFRITNDKTKVVIPYKTSNNLVILPIKINGVDLNFLLDTGVENTILFSLEEADSVEFKKIEKIKIRGLGSGEAIDAFKSNQNKIEINGFTDLSHEIYIILDQEINFSAQLGIPVHGILGYHFFKNHPIEINHFSKKVIVRDNIRSYKKATLKKYNELPISIELEKPYINTEVVLKSKLEKVKMLLDTGGSDAIWLFENDENIKCPPIFFDDFLGKGFSGDIFGKRSRIEELIFAGFKIKFPTASFPTENSIKSVNLVEGRNGSIGSGIIKRFNVIFDYPNSKMYLKKNKDFYDPFNYNMSGIEVQHVGKQLVKEEVVELKTKLVQTDTREVYNNGRLEQTIKYQFSLKPVYEISNVRPNSPAEEVGIKKGDVLSKINGESAFRFKLSQIIELLQSEEGKWISLEYERNGKMYKTKFQLKKIL